MVKKEHEMKKRFFESIKIGGTGIEKMIGRFGRKVPRVYLFERRDVFSVFDFLKGLPPFNAMSDDYFSIFVQNAHFNQFLP
jgi:hypothetical protein